MIRSIRTALAPCPGLGPVAAETRGREVAEFEGARTDRRGSEPRRARATRVDPHQCQPVARRGVHRRHHLVVGDEEILRAGDPGLDLDADRITAGSVGEHVEAWVVERPARSGCAPERALRSEHQVDAAALDPLGLDRVDRRLDAGISASTIADGQTSAASTTRGGLVDICACRSSTARRVASRALEVVGLAAQALGRLLRLSRRPLLLVMRASASSIEPVALLAQPLLNLVTGPLELRDRVAAAPRPGTSAAG